MKSREAGVTLWERRPFVFASLWLRFCFDLDPFVFHSFLLRFQAKASFLSEGLRSKTKETISFFNEGLRSKTNDRTKHHRRYGFARKTKATRFRTKRLHILSKNEGRNIISFQTLRYITKAKNEARTLEAPSCRHHWGYRGTGSGLPRHHVLTSNVLFTLPAIHHSPITAYQRVATGGPNKLIVPGQL